MLSVAKVDSPETQKRHLKGVQENNIKFLKLFKICKKEDRIFNGEFKKMKKFYRGFIKGHFFYNSDIYSNTWLQVNPSLKRYDSETWINIADKICGFLKAFPKEKIKSGKRPLNETAEYQEKLLQRSLESDIGTCGYCDRYIEIENNIIYDHGFRLGHGFRDGVCTGARFLPFERSPEAKILLVKHLKNNVEKIEKEKPTQELVNHLNSDKFKYTQNDIDELNKKSSYGTYKKVGEYKIREYLNLTIYHETSLEKLMYSWNYEMKFVLNSLERQEFKVKNWKLVKTLREIATERLNLKLSKSNSKILDNKSGVVNVFNHALINTNQT